MILTHLLQCDGCGTRLSGGDEPVSAIELSARAYAEGWRMPRRVKMDGSPSSGATRTTTNDVCPACMPTWEPRPAVDPHKNERVGGDR